MRITSVAYSPWPPVDPITSDHVRTLPTAKTEAAINKRLFSMKRVATITCDKFLLPSGRKISERDFLKPLPDPKQDLDSCQLVALHCGNLANEGHENPSATMAQNEPGLPLSSARMGRRGKTQRTHAPRGTRTRPRVRVLHKRGLPCPRGYADAPDEQHPAAIDFADPFTVCRPFRDLIGTDPISALRRSGHATNGLR